MSRRFVAQLSDGDVIRGTFAVRQKRLVPFRQKPGFFLDLVIADRTGEIPGRMWDQAEQAAQLFDVGDVVQIDGRVESYRDQLQMIIERIRLCSPAEYNRTDFLPSSSMDPEEAKERLLQWAARVQNPDLRLLLHTFFGDRELLDRFVECPGSKSLHHAHIGGLADHTLGVLVLLQAACDVHSNLDRDLLIAGGLLHDIGKIEELHVPGVIIRYTDIGRLVGHVVLTDRMVNERLSQLPDFPQELAARLTHLLLSHHGQREYGAPVLPMTPEACALHYADTLDAHVQYFREIVAAAPPGSTWSDYQDLFQRYIYLGPGQQAEESEDDR